MDSLCKASFIAWQRSQRILSVQDDLQKKKQTPKIFHLPGSVLGAMVLGEQYPDAFHDDLAVKEAHWLKEDKTTTGENVLAGR